MSKAAALLEEDIFLVADGMSRENCVLRAREAFSRANACRATFTGVLNYEKRIPAVHRAREWEDVLWYLNKTGASEFSEMKSRPYQAGALRACIEILNPVAWWRIFGDLHGSKPINFRDPFQK
jgi:hypothetical protein